MKGIQLRKLARARHKTRYRQTGRGKKWDASKRGAKWVWQRAKGRLSQPGRKAIPKVLPVLDAAPFDRKGMLGRIGKECLGDFFSQQESGARRRYIRATW